MTRLHLLSPAIQDFIEAHACDDIRTLALKKAPDASWPYRAILDQIKVRQKAKIKTPDLYETSGILFPLNETYEQSSSSACAAYKASLVEGRCFVDLTAGCGVDAFHFSKRFESAVLVEKDEHNAALLKHNMDVLKNAGRTSCAFEIFQGDAVSYVQNMGEADFVFIDPQRREKGRKGIFDLSACMPDVLSLLPFLKEKTKAVMVKTSPMLDIEKAVGVLEGVKQVHVVQWQGECKEVLYYLDFTSPVNRDDIVITAVDIDDKGYVQQEFSYKMCDEKKLSLDYGLPQKYLYEPGPAFQKSGGFKSMALCFGVQKLHPHSHLYTSDVIQDDFPGKAYEILDVVPVQAKALNIKQANLTLRNFPGTVDRLKKTLGLCDGSVHKIFATTLCHGDKKLIICAPMVRKGA